MNQEMQEINITIEEAKEHIRLAGVVERLEQNPDFKDLILNKYFKEDASRLVMLRADKAFASPERQAKLDQDMLGISVFGDFLRTIKIQGAMAKESLDGHEATREIIREELA